MSDLGIQAPTKDEDPFKDIEKTNAGFFRFD